MSEELHEIRLDDCWNRIGTWSRIEERCPLLERYVHCRNCDVFSAAGRRVLDRALPEGYAEEWAEEYAKPQAKREKGQVSVLVFRLGEEWFALPSVHISEVTETRAVHSLPHLPSRVDGGVVRGLVNVDGELKICISLGNLLSLERSTVNNNKELVGAYERMVVVRYDNGDFVFPVSEIAGTQRYLPREVQEAPATLSYAKGTYTQGVIDYQQKQVGLLDADLVFYALEKALA